MEVHNSQNADLQYACIVPGCANAYRYYSSLKKHLHKHHAEEYWGLIKSGTGNIDEISLKY